MANNFDPTRLLQFAQSAFAKLHVRSVMNPLLWIVGIALIPLLVAAHTFGDDAFVRDVLIGLVVLIIIFSLAAFAWFAIRSPDRLQSEDYVLQREQMRMQVKGRAGEPRAIDTTALPALPNPASLQNEQSGEEHDA